METAFQTAVSGTCTFKKLTTNQTKVIFKMLFETAQECNKLKPFVVDKNEENFDRLENELTKMTS